MPAPQLAIASISHRIQALSSPESILLFDVKAIERDIEHLKAISVAEAYMLTGMLKSILGDYDASNEMHQRFLHLSTGDVGLVNEIALVQQLMTAEAA